MFHVKHEAWGVWAERLRIEIAPVQAAALDRFEKLLAERAAPSGMISAGDTRHLRERHIVDSLRAAPLLGAPTGAVADLGSGAGLPGIPLAIVRPDLRFRLVDIRRRRIAFLELASDSLGLSNVDVMQLRIERLAPPIDVCLARAVADPISAWRLARPLLSSSGRLLYWAGRGFDVASGAPKGARISVSAFPGLADAGPVVIMTPQ
jgi:16S rRNA (guanine527-N7)-methyltransferase